LVNPVFAKEAAPLAEDEVAEKRHGGDFLRAALPGLPERDPCRLQCRTGERPSSRDPYADPDGKSDSEIMDFMVSRYGDFVRYRPPLKGTTLLLWFGPALLLVGAIGSLFVYLRRRNKAIIDSPLSAEEQDQADSLLNIEEPPK
jgi:cytochrome c-type biogenesis protein CcmH